MSAARWCRGHRSWPILGRTSLNRSSLAGGVVKRHLQLCLPRVVLMPRRALFLSFVVTAHREPTSGAERAALMLSTTAYQSPQSTRVVARSSATTRTGPAVALHEDGVESRKKLSPLVLCQVDHEGFASSRCSLKRVSGKATKTFRCTSGETGVRKVR